MALTPDGASLADGAFCESSAATGIDGVALSADGSILVTSAVGESSAATGVDGNESDNTLLNAGAVYAFQ